MEDTLLAAQQVGAFTPRWDAWPEPRACGGKDVTFELRPFVTDGARQPLFAPDQPSVAAEELPNHCTFGSDMYFIFTTLLSTAVQQ